MKSYSKPLIIGLITLVSIGFIGAGQAHKQGGPGFNLDRMSNRLDLTDDQRAQVEEIVASTRPEMNELREAMKENRVRLDELKQQETFDEDRIRELAGKQGELKAEMMVLRAGQRNQINAILTDEQRGQRDKWRGNRGKGGCRRF